MNMNSILKPRLNWLNNGRLEKHLIASLQLGPKRTPESQILPVYPSNSVARAPTKNQQQQSERQSK